MVVAVSNRNRITMGQCHKKHIRAGWWKKLGDGRDALFWEDVWIGDVALKNKFARLFRLDNNQDAYVNDRVQHVNGLIQFTWAWTRPPLGRVTDELEQMKGLIEGSSLLSNGSSTWQWKLDNSGGYNSRLVSLKIDERIIGRPGKLHDTMRNNYIPQKMGIFVWRALRDRIPVRVELDKRGIDVDTILCPMCNDFVETVEHTLITCKLAKDVWQAIYNWWESTPPNSSDLSDFFSGTGRGNLSGENKKIWQAIG
ncbi:uncharacterized protein [Rutidosis leptorrhynchoides]|uniref:uncharacterized protein n=1 Tax=Rutidosis leptorrhynchoides TaxID=125765 RepID=UPI003A99101F